ncbi:MAG TPA: hypothetical protein VG838_16565 [Opitutaceae bacterium]|nr:hypothetical protein [Opitutaceae bacterium]
MKPEQLSALVESVLYEGQILYPYRAVSPKKLQRFAFGRVYPSAHSEAQQESEPCVMQTQCLLRVRSPSAGARLAVTVEFLHAVDRTIARLASPLPSWKPGQSIPPHRLEAQFEAGGKIHQAWREARERRIEIAGAIADRARSLTSFSFAAMHTAEPVVDDDGRVPALILRANETISGTVELSCQRQGDDLFLVSVRIINRTVAPADSFSSDDDLVLRSLASTHTILHAEGADFISQASPPEELAAAAAECFNAGTWPVLVGDEAAGEHDTMLSSPILLSDYPQLAPENIREPHDGHRFADAVDEMETGPREILVP